MMDVEFSILTNTIYTDLLLFFNFWFKSHNDYSRIQYEHSEVEVIKAIKTFIDIKWTIDTTVYREDLQPTVFKTSNKKYEISF